MSKIVSYVDHAGFVDAIRAAADDNFRPGWRWWPPGWVTIESLCTNAGFTPAEYTGNNYPYQEDPFEPDKSMPFDPDQWP